MGWGVIAPTYTIGGIVNKKLLHRAKLSVKKLSINQLMKLAKELK